MEVAAEGTEKIEEKAGQSGLPREATEPAHVRVLKSTGEGMEIDWKDGHKSKWTFQWLRDACPCAVCHQNRAKEGRKPGEPHEGPRVVPNTNVRLYKPPLALTEAEQVGRYAIGLHWSDGHRAGMYSWVYLRENCQCPQCRAARG